MVLYRFSFNDVFFPENSYYNSDPLPVEWIEVFEESNYGKNLPKEEPVRLFNSPNKVK